MTTVIDALVVTLGLDPKDFSRNQKEAAGIFLQTAQAARKTGKEIEESGKKSTEAIHEIRIQALALFAVFTGGRGIKNFVDDLTKGDTALGRTSQFLVASAQKLNEWRGMARLTGGSADSVVGSLQSLNQSLMAMRYTGDTSLLPALRALKQAAPDVDLSFLEMNGRMLKSHELVEKLRTAFKGLDKDTALFIGQQMRLSEDLVYILTLPENEFKRYQTDLQRLTKITDEDIKAARERVRVQGQLELAFDSVGRVVLTKYTPAITSATEGLIRMTEWAQRNPQRVLEVAAAIGVLAAALASLRFAPLLIAMTKFAALLAAAYATIKLLQDMQSDKDKGLKYGSKGWYDPNSPNQPATPFKDYAKEATERRAADRHWRLTHGRSTLVDTGVRSIYGYSKTTTEDEAAFNKRHGPGSAEQSELGQFGRARGTSGGGAGGDKRADDVSEFMKMGYSREDAIAIAQNLHSESGGDHTAPGDGGQAYGAAQWHPERQAKFKEVFGKDIRGSTRQEQLQFVDWELKNTHRDAMTKMREASTVGEKAAAISRHYERPLDTEGAARNRALEAEAWSRRSFSSPIGSPSVSGPQLSAANPASSPSSVSIGQVNVSTAATDAQGIARDIKTELGKVLSAGQANYGVR